MKAGVQIGRFLGYGVETVTSVAVALLFFLIFICILNLIFPVSTGGGMSAAEFRKLIARDRTGEVAASPASGAQPAAALTVIHREVKTRRAADIAWSAALAGARLGDGDAVQTNREGSAQIDFGESQRFQLGQSSLLVVRQRAESPSGSEDQPSLIVMAGELFGTVTADAGAGGGAKPVSVVASGSTARFVSGPGKEAARFRVVVGPDRSSTLAVFAGAAEVSAGNRTVRVQANQAVTLDSTRGISAPEVLLTSPLLRDPADGAVYTYRELPPRIRLAWSGPPVAAYRVLVGRDRNFARVVLDQRVESTTLLCGSLSEGAYFWTVTVASDAAASGAAATRRFTLVRDQEPPALEVTFPSAALAVGTCTITGVTEPGTRVFVAGHRVQVDAGGRFQHELRLDRGANVILVEAIDPAGNPSYRSQVVEARF